jgi:hypothetical protein
MKIPYEPAQLERRLGELGWDIKVTGTPGPFYWGTGRRDLDKRPHPPASN